MVDDLSGADLTNVDFYGWCSLQKELSNMCPISTTILPPLVWAADEAPALLGIDASELDSKTNERVCLVHPGV